MTEDTLLSNISNNTENRKNKKWLRPWNVKQFNDLYNRDDRFFSVLIKGAIGFLNSHIKMYDKPINHFIFNTGSSYMFVESNGYEFSWNETSGEDSMYMELPRCVVELGNISIPQEELSQSFARGNYERKDEDTIKGYNAEIKRLPIEMNLSLHYTFSNFNESIVVLQELFDELVFQSYFSIAYLGQIVRCSIEFPNSTQLEIGKIDFSAAEIVQRNINLDVVICTNYPLINQKTEISSNQVISKFKGYLQPNNRADNIEILIDGVKSNINDIYMDLRKFDINKDNIINETEISLIRDFIERFDVDEDYEVTSHDIGLITESFMDEEYNVHYDILNTGKLDINNLLTIKELFNILDLNHDERVNELEINQIMNNILIAQKFDINGDLVIDYNDLRTIISYIEEHDKEKWSDLYNDFTTYLTKSIKPISEELYQYILDVTNDNLNDMKIAVEYWIANHKNEIDINNSTMQELYKLWEKLVTFKIYDMKGDGIIDKNDAQYVTDIIGANTEHTISYYESSNIIIHMNDHELHNDSITDILEIK